MFYKILKSCNSSLINQGKCVISVRHYAPRGRRASTESSQPGINKRIDFIKEMAPEYQDPEAIDTMEPNFMNLDETHRQHEMEMRKSRENIKRMIVGKKYFQSNSPNFLTYNEKEQIRALHQEDSENWTVDKLSESFPADPYTISLVIRSKWIPKDTNRIYKHDQSVRRNWENFNDGKLTVEPILALHLKKFAFRDSNKLAERPPNKKLGVEFPKPKSNEFLSIITSCSKYSESVDQPKQIESSELTIPKRRPAEDENSFIMHGKNRFSSENVTLAELQQKNPDIDFKVRSNETLKVNLDPSKLRHKFEKENNYISLTRNDEKVIESLEVQQKIEIPRKLWKKGKIYKLNDCFYADDGEFLYRVPGL